MTCCAISTWRLLAPDGKVDATTALARVELGDPAGPIDSLAIDQLRNSGVLAERNNTWETRLVFSDDLWRDAAIAGLIADNPGILGELSAVRSAMRAAVIACQMRLNSDLGSIVSLVELFAQVASRTGQARWGEVPVRSVGLPCGTRTEWAEILDHLVGNGMLGHFLSAARRTASSLLSDAPLAMTGLVDALLDSHTEAPEVTGALRAWLRLGRFVRRTLPHRRGNGYVLTSLRLLRWLPVRPRRSASG